MIYEHSRELTEQFARMLFRKHYGLQEGDPKLDALWESESRQRGDPDIGRVAQCWKSANSIIAYLPDAEARARLG